MPRFLKLQEISLPKFAMAPSWLVAYLGLSQGSPNAASIASKGAQTERSVERTRSPDGHLKGSIILVQTILPIWPKKGYKAGEKSPVLSTPGRQNPIYRAHHFISSIKTSTQHILIQRVLLSIKITSEASQKRFPIDLCTKNATCRISKQRSLQNQAIPLERPR